MINGSTGIGSINGTVAVNYLDDNTSKGRRVDLNWTIYALNNDMTLKATL